MKVSSKAGKLPSAAPKTLEPYLFHGVSLSWSDGRSQATGDCPWCRREGKFSVEVDTGKWRCLVCNEGTNAKGEPINGGNAHTFLRLLWERGNQEVANLSLGERERYYSGLARDRGLLDWATLASWGVVRSPLNDSWLVPGYGLESTLNQLYPYAPDLSNGKGGKYRLLATAGMPHQLFGIPLFSKEKSTIMICEGPWDAMVLWELLRRSKLDEGTKRLKPTSNPGGSLVRDTNVLAVPGCNVFSQRWGSLTAGKRVVLLFDNDYPKTNRMTGMVSPPAGHMGMRRITRLLVSSESPPSSIGYVDWSGKGEEYCTSLPEGYDVRDHLTKSDEGAYLDGLVERLRRLETLLYGGS